MMPIVSVIVPVYNTAPFLRQCLDSLLGQNYENMEIICVDDGSTDGSLDILSEYAKGDGRVRLISQAHQGKSAALNRGIGSALGEYLYFCDSDDYLRGEAFEKVCLRAKLDRLDMVFFNVAVTAEANVSSERISDERQYFHRAGAYPGIMRGSEFFLKLSERGEYICTVYQYLLRREFLLGTGLRFFPLPVHEDELFTLPCLLQARRVGYMSDELYVRRLREGSSLLTVYGLESVRCALLAAVHGIGAMEAECTQAEKEAVIGYLLRLLRVGRNRFEALPQGEQEGFKAWSLPEQAYFRLAMRGEVLQPELARLSASQAPSVIGGDAEAGCLIYGAGGRLLDILDEQPAFVQRIGRIFDKNKDKCGTFLPGTSKLIESPQNLTRLPEGTDVYVSVIRYFDEICEDIRQINPGLVCKSLEELLSAGGEKDCQR